MIFIKICLVFLVCLQMAAAYRMTRLSHTGTHVQRQSNLFAPLLSPISKNSREFTKLEANQLNTVKTVSLSLFSKFSSKVSLFMLLLLTPFRYFLSFLSRIAILGKKTLNRSPSSGGSSGSTTPAASESKFSFAAIQEKLKMSKADADARKYVQQKLKEIEQQEKAAALAKKKMVDPGRWPPIIIIPPSISSSKKSVATLSDTQLKGKTVLVRCDLNVPLNDGVITDDTRIRGSIPTIKYLVGKDAKVLLSSHLGRPKNGPEDKLSLAPVAPRLSELLGKEVSLVSDCIGDIRQNEIAQMNDGDVRLLENVRFYKEEEKNEKSFAMDLSKGVDVFVNDAFGTAHRAHASTEGITSYVPTKVAGFLLQKELDYLQGAVDVPKRPFAAIVGGSKVSSKISVIEAMLNKVDKLVLGGGMVFTFLKARGVPVGSSLVENEQLDLARKLERIAISKGVELVLVEDVVIADEFSDSANVKVVPYGDIPPGWMGLDIGPKSLDKVKEALSDCKTVIWNGPMGVFEMEPFSKGTFGVADALADLTGKGCVTIIGGGDSVAAVEMAGLADKMSHISTGGGASLELLEGKVLPGVAALDG